VRQVRLQPVEIHEVEEFLAILDDLARYRCAIEAHRQAGARREEDPVAPGRQGEGEARAGAREKGRLRVAPLKFGNDQSRIAIDIRTRL
jgi:hypothetical protein